MQTITFIGNGNMGLSIAQGLKKRFYIEVVGRDMKKLEEFEKNLGVSIGKYLLDGFDITNKTILLCVKPNNIEEVGKKLLGKSRLLFSVLAGTTIVKLNNHIKSEAVVRAMPNLAASVGRSMTTLTGEQKYQVEASKLFETVGATLWLSSENEIDIATALAGSGPAYLALIAEALVEGAVKQGLRRGDAIATMRGLFGGFGTLIQEIYPSILKENVMSPGGTTMAGCKVLEEGNVKETFIKAIEVAYNKTKEL